MVDVIGGSDWNSSMSGFPEWILVGATTEILSAPLPAGQPPAGLSVLAAMMASKMLQESLTMMSAAKAGAAMKSANRPTKASVRRFKGYLLRGVLVRNDV